MYVLTPLKSRAIFDIILRPHSTWASFAKDRITVPYIYRTSSPLRPPTHLLSGPQLNLPQRFLKIVWTLSRNPSLAFECSFLLKSWLIPYATFLCQRTWRCSSLSRCLPPSLYSHKGQVILWLHPKHLPKVVSIFVSIAGISLCLFAYLVLPSILIHQKLDVRHQFSCITSGRSWIVLSLKHSLNMSLSSISFFKSIWKNLVVQPLYATL